VCSLSSAGHRLIVGTSNRHVLIYDVRNLTVPEQRRESSLMNQTRCIRGFPDTTGYALSSIEGRVAVEYFNPDQNVQKNKYAFKVREEEDTRARSTWQRVTFALVSWCFSLLTLVRCDLLSLQCHRKTEGKTQILYPVNAMAFHPKSVGDEGAQCMFRLLVPAAIERPTIECARRVSVSWMGLLVCSPIVSVLLCRRADMARLPPVVAMAS
jgi:hypothetical protein